MLTVCRTCRGITDQSPHCRRCLMLSWVLSAFAGVVVASALWWAFR